MKKFNLIIIGAGSGGLVSAYLASAMKAKVALVERKKMGGDCLNTGCVPSKAIIRMGKLAKHLRTLERFGVSSPREISFSAVMQEVQRVQKRIEPHDSPERYSKLGVHCLFGHATILDPHRVQVGREIYSTESIIIASGGRPFVPAFPGIEEIPYYTSDNIWNLKQLPQNLLVLGGGVIGVELAQAFLRLGSRVTLIERNSRILSREDTIVSDLVGARLKSEGMDIFTQARVESFRSVVANKGLAKISINGQEREMGFDACFVALGRKANTEDLGLSFSLDARGCLETDAMLRTQYPNIFACGDVAGPFSFTHMASYQAGFATINALFRPLVRSKPKYTVVPWVIFSDPEVARVGLSQIEADEKNISYEISEYNIGDLDRAIIEGEDYGIVRVLTKKGTDKILGVTIVGAHAGEMLMPYVLAMQAGFGLKRIFSNIYPYPILSEANRFVAAEWRKKHVPQWIFPLLEHWHRWRR